jgi:hypothetical protein
VVAIDGGALRFARDVVAGGWIGVLEHDDDRTELRGESPADLVGKATAMIRGAKDPAGADAGGV